MLDQSVDARRSSATIARLRAELSVTQGTVAKEAGLDQSRVSRIEKGETSNASDIERVLDALGKLGSKQVKAYREFAQREWSHIDPPSFWNPQRSVLEVTEETLGKIDIFLADESHPWPLRRAMESYKGTMLRGAAYLGKLSHNIAFIGDMGVGKSTALAFAFDLLVPASTSAKPMDRPVLETGAGGTTICEVHIRKGPQFGLTIQPLSDQELHDLVADFCASKWIAATNEDKVARDIAGVSRESDRAIRNMTGLTRKSQREGTKTTTFDPVPDLIQTCGSEDEFRTRVFEMMRLGERTRRDLWYEPTVALHPMEWLRNTFRDVNNGRRTDVSLPKVIDLVLPEFDRGFGELEVTLIDTKGVDDVAVREDLDLRLRDPRTTIVFCSRFNDAPGLSSKLLLQHMRQTFSEPPTAGKVSIMTLPRDGEALAMKDDAGEAATTDEDGHEFKAAQVESDLQADGMPELPVLFFNARSNNPEEIRAQLVRQIDQMREAAADRLFDLAANVDYLLNHHEQQALALAVQEVAKRLLQFLDAHPKLGARERLAHTDAIATVRGVRYASTLWAATRRNGRYPGLNLTYQVGIGVARDAQARTKRWFASLEDALTVLRDDKDLAVAARTIDQIGKATSVTRQAFLEAVQRAGVEVYDEPITNAAVWGECAAEWGSGPGFKERVASRLERWFEKEASLKAHLEDVVIGLWEAKVIAPLRRLADTAAPAPLADADTGNNVVPFQRGN